MNAFLNNNIFKIPLKMINIGQKYSIPSAMATSRNSFLSLTIMKNILQEHRKNK